MLHYLDREREGVISYRLTGNVAVALGDPICVLGAFEHLRFLETHRSLLRFKQKFQPYWESRYLAVSTTLALPKIALALLRVHLHKGEPAV